MHRARRLRYTHNYLLPTSRWNFRRGTVARYVWENLCGQRFQRTIPTGTSNARFPQLKTARRTRTKHVVIPSFFQRRLRFTGKPKHRTCTVRVQCIFEKVFCAFVWKEIRPSRVGRCPSRRRPFSISSWTRALARAAATFLPYFISHVAYYSGAKNTLNRA